MPMKIRFDQAALLIKRNNPVKRARVDANALGAKLLATHRMTAARNRNGQAFSRRRMHNFCEFVSRPRPQQLANSGAIKLRMNIIDPNLSVACR